jgi:hypothetical protein
MYFGAIRVLHDDENPDRMALAAHGIRELIENLPKYFDLPVPRRRESLGVKVRALHQAWQKVLKRITPPDDPIPDAFVEKLKAFFEWFAVDQPERREVAAMVVRGFDPSGRQLPAAIEKDQVDEWHGLRQYFVETAHHRGSPPVDFSARLEAFERFLLELIRPHTFENADRLDDLIAEGEGNG